LKLSRNEEKIILENQKILTMLLRKNFFILCLCAGILFMLSEITSCTHEDDPISQISESTFEYGDDVVEVSNGFVFDHTHSSVRWETAYFGSSALLTGRFNDFEMFIDFDEANPDNTELMGKVILSTVNTGEPGRDAGCLLGTFGIVDGSPTTDEAIFMSTKVTHDNQGAFNVEGTLGFHGVDAPITGKLEYVGLTHFDAASGVRGAPLNLVGFTFEFDMNAKSVFGIQSGNIGDVVKVKANGQFKQSL